VATPWSARSHSHDVDTKKRGVVRPRSLVGGRLHAASFSKNHDKSSLFARRHQEGLRGRLTYRPRAAFAETPPANWHLVNTPPSGASPVVRRQHFSPRQESAFYARSAEPKHQTPILPSNPSGKRFTPHFGKTKLHANSGSVLPWNGHQLGNPAPS